jgi:SAM-dependent methyltransferase
VNLSTIFHYDTLKTTTREADDNITAPDIATVFPRSVNYDRAWVIRHSLGENVLYNLESLCEKLPLQPGMRVLDLGCGRAVSSIFLAKEFDVQVWAVDKGVDPTDSYRLIAEQECEDRVFPLRLGSRRLPFAREFFDIIVSVDSFHYFGTDERYLPYLMQFIKPSGCIGIVDMCFRRELASIAEAPSYLKNRYQDYWYFIHSVAWWRERWIKTGLVNVLCAEELPHTDFIWDLFIREFGDSTSEREVVETVAHDKGEFLRLFRLVAQRSSKEIYLQEPERE